MMSPLVLLVFDVALAALALLLAEQQRMTPALSIFGALAVLGSWQLVLFTLTHRPTVKYKIEPFYQRSHYVTSLIQVSIYVYLALYWDTIRTNAPLILAQALIGALCDIQLAWSRGRTARLSFGVMPVILSMNLFLWFLDDYFYYQILMVALAFFSKEFLTWNYDGRRRHIFNPSALPLSVVSVLILATETLNWTSGVNLVALFEFAPNFYEVVFLLGLVSQALFRTAPLSLGAVVSLYTMHYAAQGVFGEPLGDTAIHPQVFLGLTFLITDPATSPKSNLGKFLFGLTYGVSVFVLGVLLRLNHQPGFLDKLLVVPFMNLMVPLFDRLSVRLERSVASVFAGGSAPMSRFGWFAAYFVLGALILPDLKIVTTRPMTIMPKPRFYLSKEMAAIARNYFHCRTVYPQAYKPYGLAYELAHLKEIRQIYHAGLAETLMSKGPEAVK
jgi:Na+-translocating ferredoxin:NAD+ oxidoreductase RnfD subunit